jgi:hypothetical protein
MVKTTYRLIAIIAAALALFLSPLPSPCQQVLNENANGMAGTYNFVAISAAKPTEYVKLQNAIMANHTVEVVITTAPSVCTFQLQGSNSGQAWFSIGTSQSCTASGMFTVAAIPVRFVRVSVTTFTGTAPVSFYYTATR